MTIRTKHQGGCTALRTRFNEETHKNTMSDPHRVLAKKWLIRIAATLPYRTSLRPRPGGLDAVYPHSYSYIDYIDTYTASTARRHQR